MEKLEDISTHALFSVLDVCPECNSHNLVRDYSNSEVVCRDCGCVLHAKIADRGPEWRAFNKEQWRERTRTGSPMTYAIHDKGLSTKINHRNADMHGKRMTPKQRFRFYRMRKWHRRIGMQERSLAQGLKEIGRMVSRLSLPRSVYETASVIHRKAVNNGLIRGRSIRQMSVAAVYLACRQFGVARTLQEVAEASNLTEKELSRCYRFLVEELGFFVPPVKTSRYILKLSTQLNLPAQAESAANKILVAARKLNLTAGKAPTGLAAAMCYLASILVGERRPQTEFANTSKVTEVTIRNRYGELKRDLLFTFEL